MFTSFGEIHFFVFLLNEINGKVTNCNLVPRYDVMRKLTNTSIIIIIYVRQKLKVVMYHYYYHYSLKYNLEFYFWLLIRDCITLKDFKEIRKNEDFHIVFHFLLLCRKQILQESSKIWNHENEAFIALQDKQYMDMMI